MTGLRDSQRQKLYNAERATFGYSRSVKTDLRSVADVQAYVDRVTATKWWADNVTAVRNARGNRLVRRIEVRDGRGSGSARAVGMFRILIPTGMRQDWIVLHELAHCATTQELGPLAHGVYAAHGWQFAARYLSLVSRFLGREQHDRLRDQFKAHKVRYRPPRSGPKLSDEQKAANIARLAAAREVRAAKKAAAIAADPCAIEHDDKVNFREAAAVRVEVVDLTTGEQIRDGLAYRAKDKGDGHEWWHPGDGYYVRDGRIRAEEFGRRYATERPGHVIEVRVIGTPRRIGRGSIGPEVSRYRLKRSPVLVPVGD